MTSVGYRDRKVADLEGTVERRQFAAGRLELREAGGMRRLTGYAATLEKPYEVGDFEEVISRGAFKRTLSEDPDVVLLLNHTGLPLARTRSGTLTLTEDGIGLHIDAELDPDDPDVRALAPKIARGDVDEMSFAFRATGQKWDDNRTHRTLTSVTLARGDVSVVTMAANPATSVALRGRSHSSTRRASALDLTTRAAQELELLQLAAGIRELRGRYHAAQLAKLGGEGKAFPNPDGHWSFPTADRQDLQDAIQAVGRAGGSHAAVRRYLIDRARKMGLSSLIPSTWNANGTLSGRSQIAMFGSPGRDLERMERELLALAPVR